jgi:hypothetical protein
MDEFNYVFELFALLLGLAVAEMLGGFGQVLKLRARRKAEALRQAQGEREEEETPASSSVAVGQTIPASSSLAVGQTKGVRVGWMVPLLGLLVLVDLATFWAGLWMARGGIEMSMLTVFVVLALIGGYYLVATQVFPDEPELWPDFDAWYWLQKRFVVGGILTINVLANAAIALAGDMPQPTQEQLLAAPAFLAAGLLVFLNYPAFLWLALSKRKAVDVALIAFIVGTQFFYAWAALGVEGFE